MKKLITLLLTLITLTTYSQVIDYNNFNAELIDSLVFVEINDYRESYGNPKLIYSDVLHDNLSTYITGVLVEQQTAGHPKGKHILNKISVDVYDEIQSQYQNKTLKYEVDAYSEVSMLTCVTPDRFVTYQDLAKYLVKSWDNSPGHQIIIKNWASVGDGIVGIGSGSTQLGLFTWKGKTHLAIYSSFQISRNYIY
tara:strand:- start:72 stop:656 length:585 start_codon:yes stop_codon:yes gene_type:complete